MIQINHMPSIIRLNQLILNLFLNPSVAPVEAPGAQPSKVPILTVLKIDSGKQINFLIIKPNLSACKSDPSAFIELATIFYCQ